VVIETCLTCKNRYWCQKMKDNWCIDYLKDYTYFLINELEEENKHYAK